MRVIKSDQKRVTLLLDESAHRKLWLLAYAQGSNMSRVVREWAEVMFEEEEKLGAFTPRMLKEYEEETKREAVRQLEKAERREKKMALIRRMRERVNK